MTELDRQIANRPIGSDSPVAAIRAILQGFGEAPSFESVRARLEPLVRALVMSNGVFEWLGSELDRLASNPASQPGQEIGYPGAFFMGPEGRLSLIGLGDAPVTLTGEASHEVIGLVAGEATVTLYRHAERIADPTVLDRDAVLTQVLTRPMSVGEVLVLEAGQDVAEFSGTGGLLQLKTAPVWPVRWAYDRETLRPCALVAGNRSLSRVRDALEMLAQIGSHEDLEVCRRLAQHPAHFIRWTAIQTAAVLAPSEAKRMLRAARADPHPDIREAVAVALEGDPT